MKQQTNKPELVLTQEKKKENEKRIPHNYKHLVYFAHKITLPKLPRKKLTKYTVK